MRFYTADQHFFHNRVIELSQRPFSSLEEMHQVLIDRHNERIENSDDVYFLGDFGLSENPKLLSHVFNKLKGRKHLIRGNHDKREVLALRWSSEPSFKKLIKDEGRAIVLSHYAERSWDRMYRNSYHFYGHTHGKLPGLGRSTDVGVDAWDFAPVTANEAIERMMTWNADFDTYEPEENSVIKGPTQHLSLSM